MPRKHQENTAPEAEGQLIPPSTEVGKYARSFITRLGLPEPRALTRDEKRLQLPANLADLDSQELSHLMTGFAAMQNFADYQAKIIGNDLNVLDAQAEHMIEELLPQMRAASVAEKKAKSRAHPKVRELVRDADTVRAVYEHLTTLRDIYGRCYATVSREISRRQSHYEP